jgi:tRNA-splicing ligase RtcB
MRIFKKDKLVIKSWCENPENGAIEQAFTAASLPFIFRQVCLMPDTHQGYGVPIGSVIATKGVVIPNAVGVDIGCGVAAVNSNLNIKDINIDELKNIMSLIRLKVPVGFNRQKIAHPIPNPLYELFETLDGKTVVSSEHNSIPFQLGTLGGGNHFLEIQKDSEDKIWIMVHSGSRNLGKKICDHYNELAVNLNNKYFNYTKDLAFLPLDTAEASMYLKEMDFALEFAKANRNIMLKKAMSSFEEILSVKFGNIIDVQHNYAAMEHHFGENALVHRKGAIRARENEIGLIPGSQGTSSYIVRGKGSANSFMSCSHGAGRKISRSEAKKVLDLQKEIDYMNEKGILHSIRDKDNLDEAVSAYKDIDIVMKEQEELVGIVERLTPVAVIKG